MNCMPRRAIPTNDGVFPTVGEPTGVDEALQEVVQRGFQDTGAACHDVAPVGVVGSGRESDRDFDEVVRLPHAYTLQHPRYMG